MIEFDPGPPSVFAELFAQVPDYEAYKEHFWYDWGPVFYRGRLDDSARVLCIASDPGPTERIAMRVLVGDAGQRVQGFLTKIGLTRSYTCLNAFLYAFFPSHSSQALRILSDPNQQRWRNRLYTRAKGPNVQAIIAFGTNAQVAVDQWDEKGSVPVFKIPHPSSRDPQKLINSWRATIQQLRTIVTPDSDGDSTIPNYGATFTEADYARIPQYDLPFGVPSWLGDDSWGRRAHPRHDNCVSRPPRDDLHTLIWIAPRGA